MGNALAFVVNIQQDYEGPATSYEVAFNAVANDGVNSYTVTDDFIYDTTQPFATAVAAFKAAVVQSLAEQAGVTVPVANILVLFGVN